MHQFAMKYTELHFYAVWDMIELCHSKHFILLKSHEIITLHSLQSLISTGETVWALDRALLHLAIESIVVI